MIYIQHKSNDVKNQVKHNICMIWFDCNKLNDLISNMMYSATIHKCGIDAH